MNGLSDKSPETVFLFGAGASFGAAPNGAAKPPLTDGLYNALAQEFPGGWGSIPSEVAAEFRSDFEKATERYIQNPAIVTLHRQMAWFFFQYTPTKSNLYVQLVDRARNSGRSVAFATLNYERLLEVSLRHVGPAPVVDPEKPSHWELCYPHGACHIFTEGVTGGAAGVTFSPLAIKTAGSPLKIVHNRENYKHRIANDALPPVMCYFIPQKRTTAAVDFIDRQQRRYAQLVTSASTVVVIGVRVRRHDSHVWEPIARTNAKVVYCAGPSGAGEYREWAGEVGRKSTDRVLPYFFAEAFPELMHALD